MKNKLPIIILFVLCLFLVSCSNSDAIRDVDSKILSLGQMSLVQEQALLDAEEAVAELSDRERNKLENIQILLDARESYDSMSVKAVESLISGIGTVDESSGEKISEADAAFSSLRDDLQEEVSNASILRDSRAQYEQIALQEVEAAITGISTVTLRSGKAIDEARSKYNALPEDMQAKISNTDVLLNAEEEFLAINVSSVETAIKSIGEITFEKYDLIAKAREAYDKHTPDVQKNVDNYDVLVEAEASYKGIAISSVEK